MLTADPVDAAVAPAESPAAPDPAPAELKRLVPDVKDTPLDPSHSPAATILPEVVDDTVTDPDVTFSPLESPVLTAPIPVDWSAPVNDSDPPDIASRVPVADTETVLVPAGGLIILNAWMNPADWPAPPDSHRCTDVIETLL